MSSTIDFSASKSLLGADYEERVEQAKKVIDNTQFIAPTSTASGTDTLLTVVAGDGTATVKLGNLNGKASTVFSGSGIFAGPTQPRVEVGSPFKIAFDSTAGTATLYNTFGNNLWAGIGAQAGLPDTLFNITFS